MSVRNSVSMTPESRKRINVMINDRLTDQVLSIARDMHTTPNDLVNRFVEGCVQQVIQHKRPRDPAPIVDLVRKTLRRDLTFGDRLLQAFLEKHIDGWAEKTARWRELVLEEVNLSEGSELTEETVQAARERADIRWRDE